MGRRAVCGPIGRPPELRVRRGDDAEARHTGVVAGVVGEQRQVQVERGRGDPAVLALDRASRSSCGRREFGPDRAEAIGRILDLEALNELLELQPT
jgi:hypothetical protein